MKRLAVLVLVALTLAAASGVGAQDKPLTKLTFALTTKDVSVGHAAHTSLPAALGYWKDEGLDVTVASVEGSTAGVQQLAAGNIQIVSVGPEVVLISREKGVKIKAYYVQARETIFTLVVPADSAIQAVDNRDDKRYGAVTTAQWDKRKQMYTEQGIIPGTPAATELFTPALIDQINKFDAQAVIRQAKEYKPGA